MISLTIKFKGKDRDIDVTHWRYHEAEPDVGIMHPFSEDHVLKDSQTGEKLSDADYDEISEKDWDRIVEECCQYTEES